jgi:hypothetical protein
MPIDLRKSKPLEGGKIENYFQQNDSEPEGKPETSGAAADEQYSRNAFLRWRAPEFEKTEWDRKWYLVATLTLAVIIVYALVVNSPIMAITFILIAIVGYLYLEKDPRVLQFAITPGGITAGDEIYNFRDIESFWIFYEPDMKAISLKVKGKMLPHIHIPVADQDPVKIRKILLRFIPEIEQDITFVDVIEKALRL